MALRVVLRNSRSENGKRPIKIQVYFNKQSAYINLGEYVPEKYFDSKTGTVKESYPDGYRINSLIAEKLQVCNQILAYSKTNDKTAKEIKDMLVSLIENKNNYNLSVNPVGFYLRGGKLVASFREEKRTGSADSISSTINIIRKFSGSDSLYFNNITPEFLRDFKRWYLKRGKEVTYNKHLRNIKLIFNESRREMEISRDLYPFDVISIPSDYDTEIRCLDKEVLRKIYQCSGTGRDMFFLSFFFCGMNLKDIFEMPYFNDYIDVKRIKTIRSARSVNLRLKIQPEARDILNRYKDTERKKMMLTKSKNHRNFNHTINRQLYRIAEELKIPRFSFTYARHSFATLASELGYSDDIIDRALMHSEGGKMISKYRKFDFTKIDKMMRDVIRAIKKPVKLSDLPIKKEE